MGRRAVRASLLDAHLYEEVECEEVEADRRTMGQATVVALLSTTTSGIGSFENGGWEGIAFSAAAGLVGWFLWAWVACLIGTRLLPQPHASSDTGELRRTLGIASAPGILRGIVHEDDPAAHVTWSEEWTRHGVCSCSRAWPGLRASIRPAAPTRAAISIWIQRVGASRRRASTSG